MATGKSRLGVFLFTAAALGAFFAYAFWPRALDVDLAAIERRTMMVTIDEEAKTRVRDAYVVSAPVAGRLLRVEVHAGDPVIAGETVVARLAPSRPAVLDARTEAQASAAVSAAEAALALAKADVKKAVADEAYFKKEAQRYRRLRAEGVAAAARLDSAERAWRAAAAALEMANANVDMRAADLKNAAAMLMTFQEAQKTALDSNPNPQQPLELRAPVTGRILRVIEESETVLNPGAPILEVGDPEGDLEIVAELLSVDAVKVRPGDQALIDKWGGDETLSGVVSRVEPWAFTKFSALGVEEQRVNVVIDFAGDRSDRQGLGHGYRTEVRIIILRADDALVLPSSSLFRDGDNWAVFQDVDGRARLRKVEIGADNGVDAEMKIGLKEGDKVVLYPGQQVLDGSRIRQRKI